MRPSIAVIVPTKNSEHVINQCLSSIRSQTVLPDEIVVVDNYSSDRTREIAQVYTDQIFLYGPERSSQRNFGWRNCSSEILLFVDADNILETESVKAALEFVMKSDAVAAILPEYGKASGGWGQAKALEREHYNTVDWMLSPRLFRRSTLEQVGGYDEDLYAGEDWDLWARVKNYGAVERVNAKLVHLDERISLVGQMRKKFYYGLCAAKFHNRIRRYNIDVKYLNMKARFGLLWQASDFIHQPMLSMRMWGLKLAEIAAGSAGAAIGFLKKQ